MRNGICATLVLVALALMAAAPAAHAQDKGEVELAYVEWASEVASTNVVKATLERLGYDVEMTPVSVGPMYMAVAAGDVEGCVASWQPIQKANLKAVGDRLENLGPNMTGVQSGIVVPDYVTVDAIADMAGQAERFDEEIIGIDPGAGVMQQAENAMRAYGLDDFELVDSTGAMMTATLKDCVRQEKWCAVTGWTPHWMWGVWDLKYLEDPEYVFGRPEDASIQTLVRKDLKEDMPAVYPALDNFFRTSDQMAPVMVWIKDGMEPAEAAGRYLDEHPEQFAAWIGK